MTTEDMLDFQNYLQNCTTAQVKAVVDKEHAAGHYDYATLALIELGHRLAKRRED